MIGHRLLLSLLCGGVFWTAGCVGGNGPNEVMQSQHSTFVKTSAAFPDFELKDLSGQVHTLADYQGRVLLIDVWATWCPPCMAEMPDLKKLDDSLRDQGLSILGVSLDTDAGQLRNYLQQAGIGWPQYSEFKGWDTSLVETWRIDSIPQTFVIDRKGQLVARGLKGERLRQAIEAALAK